MAEISCLNCTGERRTKCIDVFDISRTVLKQTADLGAELMNDFPGDPVVATAVMNKQSGEVAEFTEYLGEQLGNLGCKLDPEQISERLAQE